MLAGAFNRHKLVWSSFFEFDISPHPPSPSPIYCPSTIITWNGWQPKLAKRRQNKDHRKMGCRTVDYMYIMSYCCMGVIWWFDLHICYLSLSHHTLVVFIICQYLIEFVLSVCCSCDLYFKADLVTDVGRFSRSSMCLSLYSIFSGVLFWIITLVSVCTVQSRASPVCMEQSTSKMSLKCL